MNGREPELSSAAVDAAGVDAWAASVGSVFFVVAGSFVVEDEGERGAGVDEAATPLAPARTGGEGAAWAGSAGAAAE